MTLQPNKTHIAIIVIILVGLLFMIQLIVNANRTAKHYETKLEEVKKETCYPLFQKLKAIKTNHEIAIEDQELKYIRFTKTQFANDWKGGTGDLGVLDEAIGSGADRIRKREQQSSLVREQIANCDRNTFNK